MKMKNIYKISFLAILLGLTSCKKDDDGVVITPPRDRAEVYGENILEIENYLKNNYLVINGDDVEVKAIDTDQTSIWDQTAFPLLSATVKNDVRKTVYTDGASDDTVDYKLYYIVLNQGGGQAPTQVDSTFTAYKGWNFDNEIFDQNNTGYWFSYPESELSSISGFRQILTKSGINAAASSSLNTSTGEVTYTDYGNVLVFIPSGLAYFATGSSQIGAYEPIVFQIKLYAIKERDHDKDGVLSKYEDKFSDGDYFNDDTDGDTIPDFFDVDDDGDGKLTKVENTYDSNGDVIIPFDDCDNDGVPNYLDLDDNC